MHTTDISMKHIKIIRSHNKYNYEPKCLLVYKATSTQIVVSNLAKLPAMRPTADRLMPPVTQPHKG